MNCLCFFLNKQKCTDARKQFCKRLLDIYYNFKSDAIVHDDESVFSANYPP